jgi:hypothetical protein
MEVEKMLKKRLEGSPFGSSAILKIIKDAFEREVSSPLGTIGD